MTSDSLERTLLQLHFDIPAGLIERAMTAATRDPIRARPGVHRRASTRLLTAVAAGAVAVVVANVVAAYLAPIYGQALADAPIVGNVAGTVLRYSGLDANKITTVNDSATSSGHTLKLMGAYADTERTVLLIEVDGQPHHLPNKQQACCAVLGTLSDQFGHTYHQVNNPDQLSPTFEPLDWPANQVGARLTFHSNTLADTQITAGNWDLHVTLVQVKGRVLPVPSPVIANGITYTFTSLHLSGTRLRILYKLSGTPVDELRKRVYSSAPPVDNSFYQQYLMPQLTDAAGNKAMLVESGMTLPKQGPAEAQYTAVVPGPGQYELTLGNAAGLAKVVIDVP